MVCDCPVGSVDPLVPQSHFVEVDILFKVRNM